MELELLQRFYLISLDVFSENKYPLDKNNRVTAWLSLLATRNVDDLTEILAVYPWLEAIYQDMASYLHKPEEVLTMFSDALKILDNNTVQYMIDEMQNTIIPGIYYFYVRLDPELSYFSIYNNFFE